MFDHVHHPENCVNIEFQTHKINLSVLSWGAFSYFRMIFSDHSKKNGSDQLTIRLPDDFGEIFDLLSSNPLPRDCAKGFDHAVKLREQALCLGVDPFSRISGLIESTIFKLVANYCRSPQALSSLEMVWKKRPGNEVQWSQFFIRSFELQTFLSHSVLPLNAELVDVRNYEVLEKIKNSDEHNERLYSLRLLAEKVFPE